MRDVTKEMSSHLVSGCIWAASSYTSLSPYSKIFQTIRLLAKSDFFLYFLFMHEITEEMSSYLVRCWIRTGLSYALLDPHIDSSFLVVNHTWPKKKKERTDNNWRRSLVSKKRWKWTIFSILLRSLNLILYQKAFVRELLDNILAKNSSSKMLSSY